MAGIACVTDIVHRNTVLKIDHKFRINTFITHFSYNLFEPKLCTHDCGLILLLQGKFT